MRSAVIEAETREEVMQEMQKRMMDMERVFAKQLRQAVGHISLRPLPTNARFRWNEMKPRPTRKSTCFISLEHSTRKMLRATSMMAILALKVDIRKRTLPRARSSHLRSVEALSDQFLNIDNSTDGNQ